KFAEPILEWVGDWLPREAKDATVWVQPTGAALHPPLITPGTPAQARVRIGRRRDGADEIQEWLFAEAWWSPQVLMPPIAAFIGWLCTRGPWLLLFHLNQRVLASPRLGTWLAVAISIPISVAWAIASLVINLALLVASLFALIPIRGVRRGVYAVLRMLTGVL